MHASPRRRPGARPRRALALPLVLLGAWLAGCAAPAQEAPPAVVADEKEDPPLARLVGLRPPPAAAPAQPPVDVAWIGGEVSALSPRAG